MANYLYATKAKKVKISSLQSEADSVHRLNENVVSIDFGTTFCSVAFTLKDTPGKSVENIELEPGRKRIPTAILLHGDQQLLRVADFGACAQENVTTLTRSELQNNYLYFELFKMRLRNHVSLHACCRVLYNVQAQKVSRPIKGVYH